MSSPRRLLLSLLAAASVSACAEMPAAAPAAQQPGTLVIGGAEYDVTWGLPAVKSPALRDEDQ